MYINRLLEQINAIQKKTEALESILHQKTDRSELNKYEILYESLEMKENTFNDINDNINQLSRKLNEISKYIFNNSFFLYFIFLNYYILILKIVIIQLTKKNIMTICRLSHQLTK